ncbi:hypothetical protein [Brachyspira pilosicoli]|uniref:Uncharacterized protein n=1 Tax=Brachyspira pilosicoli TaxID=52584 RepID=A0A5C8EZQ1_BRAPL|nr:hypothetical protein [Brachyspira pilosicoli]TXJ43455.1 hypothetical protein EPJ72_04235 [Brachyspira pilosicoli]
MSKKLLTIFSLLLIFFAMSCNNKSTDSTPTGPTGTTPTETPIPPLKNSQYVGKWDREKSNAPVIEIKQDGSIDLFDNNQKLFGSSSGTDVIKEKDTVFKATFSKEGQKAEIVLTFTDSKTGSMLLNNENNIPIVKK